MVVLKNGARVSNLIYYRLDSDPERPVPMNFQWFSTWALEIFLKSFLNLVNNDQFGFQTKSFVIF